MIDKGIYDVLNNTSLEKRDAIELLLRSFHGELSNMFSNYFVSKDLIVAIEAELSDLCETLFSKFNKILKLKAEVNIIGNQLVVNYPNLPEFLAQF